MIINTVQLLIRRLNLLKLEQLCLSPAKAGAQVFIEQAERTWVPAFAGKGQSFTISNRRINNNL